jgi:hypothetical protein
MFHAPERFPPMGSSKRYSAKNRKAAGIIPAADLPAM